MKMTMIDGDKDLIVLMVKILLKFGEIKCLNLPTKNLIIIGDEFDEKVEWTKI